MTKFEIIEALEGCYAPNPMGAYQLVKDGNYHTDYGPFPLINYEYGQLEVMLRKAIKPDEVARQHSERLLMLHSDQIMDKGTQEAQDWFNSLTSAGQKAQIRIRFEDWQQEQQQALQAAGAYE